MTVTSWHLVPPRVRTSNADRVRVRVRVRERKVLSVGLERLYLTAISLSFITTMLNIPGPVIVKAVPGAVALGLAIMLTPRWMFGHLRIDPMMALFLAWCVITVGWSIDRNASIQNVGREFARIGTIAISVGIIGVQRTRIGLAWLLIGLIILTYGRWIVDPVGSTTPAFGDYQFGLRGPFSHKNTLAKMCAIAILLTLSLPWTKRRKLVVIAAAAILLQQSTATTSLFATLGGVLIYFWLTLTLPSKRRQSYFRFLSLIGAVGTIALVVIFFIPQAVAATGKDLTLTGRTQIWSAVIPLVQDGFFRGYGFGAVWERTSDITRGVERTVGFAVSDSHSVIFEMLLHTGVIGALLMASWHLATVIRAANRLRLEPATGAWILSSVFALTVISFTDAMFLGGWIPLYVVLAGSALNMGVPPPHLRSSSDASPRAGTGARP